MIGAVGFAALILQSQFDIGTVPDSIAYGSIESFVSTKWSNSNAELDKIEQQIYGWQHGAIRVPLEDVVGGSAMDRRRSHCRWSTNSCMPSNRGNFNSSNLMRPLVLRKLP